MTKPLSKEQQLFKQKKPTKKRCKLCKKLFVPSREMQPCCSYAHELEYVSNNIDLLVESGKKLRNKEKKKAKQEATLDKRVQDLAQRYGRLRELSRGNDFCVTCGSKANKYDGGHCFPKSTYTAIRYYTLQINPQCVNCNRYNGGRPLEYEKYMRKRFGDEKYEWLSSQRRVTRKYTKEYKEKYLRVMGKRIKRYEIRIIHD